MSILSPCYEGEKAGRKGRREDFPLGWREWEGVSMTLLPMDIGSDGT